MPRQQPMNERPADERAKDFGAVTLGFSQDEAAAEAARCLQCAKPACRDGCPLGINIPAFIQKITVNDMEMALAVIKSRNNLPAVCGRVCPQERQCQLACVLAEKEEGIAIGHLERYVSDWEMKARPHGSYPHRIGKCPTSVRIAVIGSGPASLACAADLARLGFGVTVFESLHTAGGILRYGVPNFRLPGEILDYELHNLSNLGILFALNSLIGRNKTVNELLGEGFSAVFIGSGAGLPRFLGIPGENLNHVVSANEFLTRVNLMHADPASTGDPIPVGKNVAVIGGGATALDAARTALRRGAEAVTVIYRRGEADMTARPEEIRHAREEGVQIRFSTIPVRFIGDAAGCITGVECVLAQPGDPDDSGRHQPVALPGTNTTLPADMAMVAIGCGPNPVLPSLSKDLVLHANGHLLIDAEHMTSIPGVFAAGDAGRGDAILAAMARGKQGAYFILRYFQKKGIVAEDTGA